MSRDRDLLEASPSTGWRTVYHVMGVSGGDGLAGSGVCLTCLTPNQDINALGTPGCVHTSAIVAARHETSETNANGGGT